MRNVKVMLVILLALLAGNAVAQTPCLFFSEYMEGSSYNKAIEIYNATDSDIDLSLVTVQLYSNGAASPTASVTLSGVLASDSVFVLSHGSASAAILALADLTSSAVCNWNGDDAVALVFDGTIVDVFGQIGLDPGSAWGVAPTVSVNATLQRMTSICCGDTDGSDAFDPAVEYVGLPIDDITGLGAHTADCEAVPVEIRSLDSMKALYR